MTAYAFKARCLAVIDDVMTKRESIVITKRGKPIAKLVPVNAKMDEIFGFFIGKGSITGNIVSPALSEEEWGLLN